MKRSSEPARSASQARILSIDRQAAVSQLRQRRAALPHRHRSRTDERPAASRAWTHLDKTASSRRWTERTGERGFNGPSAAPDSFRSME